MAILNYDLIPYKEKRSTGERVVRNAFYMPDPSEHENPNLYKGYYTDDFFGLEIDAIVPFNETMTKMLDW